MSLTHVYSHTLLRLCYHAHLRNRILLEPTIALRVIHTVPCQPLCRCVRIYPRFLAVFHGVLPTCEYAIWAVISCADVLAAEVSLVFPHLLSLQASERRGTRCHWIHLYHQIYAILSQVIVGGMPY